MRVRSSVEGGLSSSAGYTQTESYTYDDNGNILTVSDGTNTTSYVYDSANQLIRENNQAGGFTHTWEYDDAGNIVKRMKFAYVAGSLSGFKGTVTYTYGDSQWGDLLTAYNGKALKYDTIGNLLYDRTWSYTWQHGRQLAAMFNGTTTWTYTYDANGMRTSRSNGSTTYSYVYDGSLLTEMTVGSNTLQFAYDAEGRPLTLQLNNDYYYFYVTNLQGDVIALTDHTGKEMVSYGYDAWGNLVSLSGPMAVSLGFLNPLCYRGYICDYETGLYYVSSRYYDPEIGRFINTDAFPSTGQGFLGNNMFAYCGNNPISRVEIEGYFWDTVFDVVSLCFSVAEVIKNPDDPMAWLGVAADIASLAIPCVTGGSAIIKAATKADDVIDTVKAIDNVDNIVDTTKAIENTQTAVKIHGNSLSTTKETVGYALRNNDTHEIMKFGETTRGTKRYTKKFYAENNVYMDIMESGSKYDMHYWQHEKILEYTRRNGHRPPWNKSNW